MNCIICSQNTATPGWETCESCDREAAFEREGVVFVDQLGISWTEEEIQEAGGIDEVRKMSSEADARGKYIK